MRVSIFRKILISLAFLTTSAISSSIAVADTALSFTGGSSYTWAGASIGWEFSITQPITVNSLGVYDFGGDGLIDAHEVGIFPAGVNTPLVTTTVTTTDTLDSGFRYAPISPLILAPGSYVVAARMPTGSDLGTSFATQSTAPEISYTKEWFLYSASFELPTSDWAADGGNFGANFQFTPGTISAIAVPTLSQNMLLVLSVLLVLFGLRYRNNFQPRKN